MANEWFPLPSGKLICHQNALMQHEDAKNWCNMAGGYLAEITHRDDAQAILHAIWKATKDTHKTSSRFRIGAIPKNNQWR